MRLSGVCLFQTQAGSTRGAGQAKAKSRTTSCPESGGMAFRTEGVRERSGHPGAIVRELFFSKNKFQRLAEGKATWLILTHPEQPAQCTGALS